MESYLHALFKAFFGAVSVKVVKEQEEEKEPSGRSSKSRQRREKERLQDPEGLVFYIERGPKEQATFSVFDAKDVLLFRHDGALQIPDESGAAEAVKSFVYRALADYTQKSLPWGSLMGVRPTKLARRKMEEMLEDRSRETGGEQDDSLDLFSPEEKQSIVNFYQNRYFVSGKKARLATGIAERELSLIRRLHPEKGFSLYVGVPFCPTRCLYCSFVSNAVGSCRELVEPSLEATVKEIRACARIMQGHILDTVYIGGGTPTALDASQLQRLMGAISDSFDLSGVLEYTVEAGRADSITAEKLRIIREGGAGRISVNPQSMNEETLRLIGRAATAEQVRSAFHLAREEGFSHINMDLILGLPGENEQMVQRTLEEVERLGPDSMTVHSLAVKRGSDLNRLMIEKGIDVSWDTMSAMEKAYEAADRMGLLPYYLYRQKNMTGNLENVGFAGEGKFGIYNILIMEEVQSVIACGAGTITKKVGDGSIQRCDNPRDVKLYIETVDERIREKAELFA
ncbi:MAG: coproporphyrinogen dehydrogenase HemZ [Lachnospiraceae bacterium]|nr:coproporphyrinogen dehydrogenase HemZ [Lachnospiraceae bacterium]